MIYEVVVTTVDEMNAVHIAPMGIRHEDEWVVIAPFKPSQTLNNLQTSGTAVVNITDDVRVYAGCLTGKTDWPTYSTSKVKGRALEAALSYRELKVVRQVDDSLRPKIYLSEVCSTLIKPFPGFNRAQAAVIEAAILVSRLHMLPAEKVDSEMEYLSIAIEKTAGDGELEAWQWIVEAITEFRRRTG